MTLVRTNVPPAFAALKQYPTSQYQSVGYETFEYASPMIFLDTQYWSFDRPVYPMIELMKLRGNVENLDMGIYDTVTEIAAHLEQFQ